MKIGQWMTIKSVICLVVGTVFVLMPGLLLAYFGVPNAEPSGLFYIARLFGVMFFMLGLMLWFGRTLPESDALRVMAPSVVIGDAVGFVVTLFAQVSGMMNAMGWFVVALYFVLMVSFGALLLPKQISPSQAN
jgi:hypothetical protein